MIPIQSNSYLPTDENRRPLQSTHRQQPPSVNPAISNMTQYTLAQPNSSFPVTRISETINRASLQIPSATSAFTMSAQQIDKQILQAEFYIYNPENAYNEAFRTGLPIALPKEKEPEKSITFSNHRRYSLMRVNQEFDIGQEIIFKFKNHFHEKVYMFLICKIGELTYTLHPELRRHNYSGLTSPFISKEYAAKEKLIFIIPTEELEGFGELKKGQKKQMTMSCVVSTISDPNSEEFKKESFKAKGSLLNKIVRFKSTFLANKRT